MQGKFLLMWCEALLLACAYTHMVERSPALTLWLCNFIMTHFTGVYLRYFTMFILLAITSIM